MAALEVLALDTVTPQIRAPGAADTYTMPRAAKIGNSGAFYNTPVLDLIFGSGQCLIGSNGLAQVQLGDTNPLQAKVGFGIGATITGAADTILVRDAANTFAQRNGTNAQASRVYNTFTDASNYERAALDWTTTANTLTIGTQKLGTGATRAVACVVGGTTVLSLNTSNAVLAVSTGGLGYGTGSGGAVTQATSRTTGVTLNTPTGAITLVSAAGTTAVQSFTVTNSTVAATDVVMVCQKSGTDIYSILDVTAVAAGSFRISFATSGGTTTEQPVFNFVVIKGVTA